MREKNFDGENYPTHVTRLWIENDRGLYNKARTKADELEGTALTGYCTRLLLDVEKDDEFKGFVWDYLGWGYLKADLKSDLFRYACEAIDWRAIRLSLLSR